jgi:hypothetical protein
VDIAQLALSHPSVVAGLRPQRNLKRLRLPLGRQRMIPKSGYRFSEKIMRQQEVKAR